MVSFSRICELSKQGISKGFCRLLKPFKSIQLKLAKVIFGLEMTKIAHLD